MTVPCSLAGLALSCVFALGHDAAAQGGRGEPGLALRAAKALTAEREGPGFIDDAILLVKDGLIEAVGRAGEVSVPPGYELSTSVRAGSCRA